jgi:hypothetical protein
MKSDKNINKKYVRDIKSGLAVSLALGGYFTLALKVLQTGGAGTFFLYLLSPFLVAAIWELCGSRYVRFFWRDIVIVFCFALTLCVVMPDRSRAPKTYSLPFPDQAQMLAYSPEAAGEYDARKKLYESYLVDGELWYMDLLRAILICPPSPANYKMLGLNRPIVSPAMIPGRPHEVKWLDSKGIYEPVMTISSLRIMAPVMRYAINYNLKILSGQIAGVYNSTTTIVNTGNYAYILDSARIDEDPALFGRLLKYDNLMLRACATDALLRIQPDRATIKQLETSRPQICSALVCDFGTPDFEMRRQIFDNLGCGKYDNCRFPKNLNFRERNLNQLDHGDNRCTAN